MKKDEKRGKRRRKEKEGRRKREMEKEPMQTDDTEKKIS